MIKNIIFSGAAIEDGTLKPGDRLLEVNNECVDGMSQSDVVTLLKSFSLDSMVNLVISRHAIGMKPAFKKYNQFALNTSCFWIKYYPSSCAISQSFSNTKIMNKLIHYYYC